ncbi:MAG: ParB N-terminal domain-containing protein, partial [bacterium]|nr:ParB N-terminal domain-containing protein [bacterium]
MKMLDENMTVFSVDTLRVSISEIKIGPRFRKDMGGLADLAESIELEGLLQPIGITKDNELVFGHRRINACRSLGWTEIDARIVQVSSLVAGEFAENEARKDFTPSERVAITEALRTHSHGGDRSKSAFADLKSEEAAQRAQIGCAMLVRTAFVEGVKRFISLFEPTPPLFIAPFSERVIMSKGVVRDPSQKYLCEQTGKLKTPSTATSYAWFVWTKGHKGATAVNWIPPCREELEREGDY